jgi:hypothetical protein
LNGGGETLLLQNDDFPPFKPLRQANFIDLYLSSSKCTQIKRPTVYHTLAESTLDWVAGTNPGTIYDETQ